MGAALDILPAHCNRECPDVSCREILQRLLGEVTVVEIDGRLQAYPDDQSQHERASSQFVARLAVCIARQNL